MTILLPCNLIEAIPWSLTPTGFSGGGVLALKDLYYFYPS